MYVMKCSKGEGFSQGTLIRYGNIELSPAAGILNYGQVKITHTIYTCVSLVFVSIFIQFLYITHTHTHTTKVKFCYISRVKSSHKASNSKTWFSFRESLRG